MFRFPRRTQILCLDVKHLDCDPDFLTSLNKDTNEVSSKVFPNNMKRGIFYLKTYEEQ